MAEPTPDASALPLPDTPNLEWLRKQARHRLAELRESDPDAKLARAQFDVARRYGFSSWRALKAYLDAQTVDGQLFDAAKKGDVARLADLLDRHPDSRTARNRPYGQTLLHVAADRGHGAAVAMLVSRGLEVNARDTGDNTCPMHWAAAGGHLEVVRLLIDAGGDVVGDGDDHELQVIGWATCWTYDAARHAIADLLVEHGARHHIFSAIALNSGAEVRRIVAADPTALSKPMSRNENLQLPLHFAIRKNRPEMVALLLELGADPAATDGLGQTAVLYASDPGVDRDVIQTLADRGVMGQFGQLLLGNEVADFEAVAGTLHMVAKRGDMRGVRWLLEHGADPNELWAHWDADVTPLHLAAAQGHVDVVRLLLGAGADPRIRDSKHDGDARGWAEYGRVPPAERWREVAQMLDDYGSS